MKSMRPLGLLALAAALAVPAAGSATSSDLASAVQLVKSKGYRVNSTRTWEPSFPLNALIGTYAKSGDGYNQRAFFFHGSR